MRVREDIVQAGRPEAPLHREGRRSQRPWGPLEPPRVTLEAVKRGSQPVRVPHAVCMPPPGGQRVG